MTTPSRFNQQTVYAAKDMFIERVEREHKATDKSTDDEPMILVLSSYASVMACCNSNDQLLLCADVPNAVLENDVVDPSDFEKGHSNQFFTTLKKTLDGPAELEDFTRKILILLSLAKEYHVA